MRNLLRFALLLIALTACTQRGAITYDPGAPATGTRETVFVATARAIDPKTGEFGKNRVSADNYARFVVQVPPKRKPGQIRYPGRLGGPDPTTDFLTVDRTLFQSPNEFRESLAATLKQQPPGYREVRVFVHGFNTTFAEGLYRLAQLDTDLGFPGVAVHYAWPSRGRPLAYFADHDSAIYSRDGFEALLNEVVAAGADRIILVGHSMGSLLVMEGLRQIAIGRNEPVLSHLGGVVLISPDIAVDVFQKEARRIGTLPQPFFVFTSQKDKALRLSATLSGRPDRLGNLTSPEEVAEFKVTLIDVSEFSTKDGHFTVGDSPALIAIIGRMAELDAAYGAQEDRLGFLGGTLMNFDNANQVIIHAPYGKPGER